MDKLFIGMGFITTGLLLVFIVTLVVGLISDAIRKAAWIYKYKHRFDKPPTAACYCIDCEFHGDATDRTICTKPRIYTADEWFCQAAKPKERGK